MSIGAVDDNKAVATIMRELRPKYLGGLGCDIHMFDRSRVFAFACVLAGDPRGQKAFRMYSDEMMAEVLDEEDMSIWRQRKAELA